MFYKTKRISALLLSIGLIVGLLGQDVSAQSTIYQNTNRDTLPPEEKMEIKEPYLEEYDELLQTEQTEESLVSALMDTYDVDFTTAQADVSEFLTLLQEHHLLADD